MRRSVYDALSVSERDAAHSAAAGRLRAGGASFEALAAHLSAVRPAGSAAVADALRQAMARAAPEAAIRWLGRALEEQAPEPPRPSCCTSWGAPRSAPTTRSPSGTSPGRDRAPRARGRGGFAPRALELGREWDVADRERRQELREQIDQELIGWRAGQGGGPEGFGELFDTMRGTSDRAGARSSSSRWP